MGFSEHDGQLIRPSGNNVPIYLVLRGLLSFIPDPATYVRLFSDRPAEVNDYLIGQIPKGPDISPGAVLISAGPSIFLISNGMRQGITSPAAFNKYFKCQATAVPEIVADYIPRGSNID